jgi:DNA primase
MAFQSSQIVDEIKGRIDIFDVISERLPLKKAGQNWVGLCPFHSEKTPSFTVNPSKQIFHCFGCHTGGDVITFFMRYEKLSFLETITELAKKAGLQYEPSRSDYLEKDKNAVFLEILKEAASFYITHLNKDKTVVDYLLSRGISQESQRRFYIGYAPNVTNGLYTFLTGKGYQEAAIRDAGVLSKEKRMDLLRKRIVFPIFNISGEVIALGGRVLDNSLPKYLNSPETVLFNKRRVLYGLSQAIQQNKRDEFIVVEGYFDVIASHQHGFTNTIAPLGTALTEEHSRLLKRFTRKVVMVFDGDEAGLRAARRGFATLFKSGIEAKALMLPKGEDPDSILKTQGAKTYSALLEMAMPFADFFAAQNSDKQTVLKEAIEIAASMPDNIQQGYTIKALAKAFAIDERFLVNTMLNSKKHYLLNPVSTSSPVQKRPKEEECILGIVIQNPHLISHVFDLLFLDDFQDNIVKGLIQHIVSTDEKDSDKLIQSLIQSAQSDEEKSLVTKLAFKESLKNEPEKMLRAWILIILEKKIEKESQIVQSKLRQMNSPGDVSRDAMLNKVRELALKKFQLSQERKSLHKEKHYV